MRYFFNSIKTPLIFFYIPKNFLVYKNKKEFYIKQIAKEEYDNGNITKQCYDAMMKYEVEITGINYLSFTRNLKITVKSPALISKTGGVVQGMSGTPIVQNGKLIGAINAVNTENPINAYGVFIDKLL